MEFEIPAWVPGFRGMSSNETIRRVSLFTTPLVSPGLHSVEITNLGNAETVPLPLDFIFVEHGDVGSGTARFSTQAPLGGKLTQTSSSSSKSTGIGAPATNAPPSSKFKLGYIIGAGAGGAVLLAITGFLIYRCLKSRKESRGPSHTPEHTQLLSGLTRQPSAPPSYTPTLGPEHSISPFESSSGDRSPARVIPPKSSRLAMLSPSESQDLASHPVPVSSPWRASSLPPYRVDSSSSQLRAVPPVVPRRLPPKLPPPK